VAPLLSHRASTSCTAGRAYFAVNAIGKAEVERYAKRKR